MAMADQCPTKKVDLEPQHRQNGLKGCGFSAMGSVRHQNTKDRSRSNAMLEEENKLLGEFLNSKVRSILVMDGSDILADRWRRYFNSSCKEGFAESGKAWSRIRLA